LAKPTKRQIERASQLEKAEKVLKQLRRESKALEEGKGKHGSLSSHLEGFYAEIAVLAKGKTLVEATPLVVDQINDIIRDAKKIVQHDVYLDRIKEFVPAGNNPFYPDVLVIARAVRQSLERCEGEFDSQTQRIKKATTRARTVIGALECFLSGQENADLALKEDVERFVGGGVHDSCFYYDNDVGDTCFDFDRLDSQSVENYIMEIEIDEDDSEHSEAEDTNDDEQEEADE